ncbi:undecaprenyl/decaprenyl-phosphate alpha-N-acetylglucosaminyl 1-phosphate transferase, partial [Candidatus Uhrbacteria bacterium]|nr:undecaprenyl/decaprenyl-phosphate alpha-N-acetylglucosaminyl 1-phosphate transferase [Candidatus Uhrbacteria bacterium]
MDFFITALGALIVSFACTAITRTSAVRYGVVDIPGGMRKIHSSPVPLLGGLALYSALVMMIALYFFLRPESWHVIVDSQVHPTHLLGILLGGFFLVVGGTLDDIFHFGPKKQIIWPILAVLTVIAFGIGVEVISNPFGGAIDLGKYHIVDALTFVWLMGTIYTTKLLDGLDGLVSGITVIGMALIAIISVFFFINYPTAILATITAGVFMGFLFWNFHPAKIFLGESGSTLAGYLLGVFAIISGAKFATLLLILGIPILDAVWVVVRRIFIERRSPFSGDRKHLHFRLLDSGFSHRTSVLILYFFSASFGALALFLQSSQKILALLAVALLMLLTGILLVKRR